MYWAPEFANDPLENVSAQPVAGPSGIKRKRNASGTGAKRGRKKRQVSGGSSGPDVALGIDDDMDEG